MFQDCCASWFFRPMADACHTQQHESVLHKACCLKNLHSEVMTPKLVFCREDDTVKQAAAIMERKQVRRLPVLGFDRRLVGIVSTGDISTHAPHELAGELIEEVSRPEHRNLAETA